MKRFLKYSLIFFIASFVILLCYYSLKYYPYYEVKQFRRKIKAGMTRNELHEVFGKPDTDSFAVKGLDRWFLDIGNIDAYYWDKNEKDKVSFVRLRFWTPVGPRVVTVKE